MATTITYETTLDMRYLMNKSKHDLAHMVLEYARLYEKERDRQTPRPQYGFQIIADKNLPPSTCEFRDGEGRTLGKFQIEP